MNKCFNELSFSEAERLALLMEELGEAVQAIGKVLRHGYKSTHPLSEESNRCGLERELGDVLAAMEIMLLADDINRVSLGKYREIKMIRVSTYLHHQEIKGSKP